MARPAPDHAPHRLRRLVAWASSSASSAPSTHAFAAGGPSPLPELPIQYADYAAWQRRVAAAATASTQQLDYWRQQLAGAPAPLELPTDRPAAARQTYRGARRRLRAPAELARARLDALGRQDGATLFMALLAAFQALLHRLTGQDDLAVGSPIAGRTRAETRGR